MADSDVQITEGSGIAIDTRTESTNGNHRQVVVIGDPSANTGIAPVDATAGLKVDLGTDNDVTVAGVATATKQSDGSQKTQVVDGSGNVIGSTSNALDINIKSGNITGFATSAKQDTGNTSLGNIDTSTAASKTDLDTLAGAIKNEDVASANADPGVVINAMRQDTPANTSGTDGDYEPLRVSAGRLWTSAKIDTALPAGTNAIGKLAANSGVTVGAVEIASAQTLAAVTNITNVVHVDDNSSSLTVDGTVAVTNSSLTTLAGAVYTEDLASQNADPGIQVLTVRKNTAAATSGTDGDYQPLITDTNGKLHVNTGLTQPTTPSDTQPVSLAAETTKVIGTARVIGNGGATIDSTVGAGTAPTNQLVVGALYNSTEISPTTGQAFALQADSKGRLRQVIMDAAGNTRGANVNSSNQLSVSVDNTPTVDTELPSAAALADAASNPTTPMIGSAQMIYNGSTWDLRREVNGDSQGGTGLPEAVMGAYNAFNYDRWRNNVEITYLSSSGRTTTQTQGDQTNYNGKGVIVTLDVTNAGTGSITLEIDGKDSASGKYTALLTGTAVTSNSTNIYKIYPGLTAAANSYANDILPRIWRIKVTANNANSVTYSVGFVVMV